MLYEKIIKELEKKIMKTGKMGIEQVRISMDLSDDEKELFINDISEKFDAHYFWELENNTLIITYTEE